MTGSMTSTVTVARTVPRATADRVATDNSPPRAGFCLSVAEAGGGSAGGASLVRVKS